MRVSVGIIAAHDVLPSYRRNAFLMVRSLLTGGVDRHAVAKCSFRVSRRVGQVRHHVEVVRRLLHSHS